MAHRFYVWGLSSATTKYLQLHWKAESLTILKTRELHKLLITINYSPNRDKTAVDQGFLSDRRTIRHNETQTWWDIFVVLSIMVICQWTAHGYFPGIWPFCVLRMVNLKQPGVNWWTSQVYTSHTTVSLLHLCACLGEAHTAHLLLYR